MRFNWTVFRYSAAHNLVYLLVLSCVTVLAWVSAQHSVTLKPLPVRAYNTYQCSTLYKGKTSIENKAETQRTFRILDYFHVEAFSVADALCSSPQMGEKFDRVEISWVSRDRVDRRRLFEQYYQLVIAKPELLQRTRINGVSPYTAIANYADYSSQFIAFGKAPALNDDYFRGKKLGLLDDPNSLSGFQIPKSALKRAAIDESIFQVLVYKTHYELYRALFMKEVDLIASFKWSGPENILTEHMPKVANARPLQSLPLEERIPGPRWFLHPGLVDSSIHCHVLNALGDFSRKAKAPYLKDIQVSRSCAVGDYYAL